MVGVQEVSNKHLTGLTGHAGTERMSQVERQSKGSELGEMPVGEGLSSRDKVP